MNFSLTDEVMGNEEVSVRLQNTICRIVGRKVNFTFEYLLRVKETLLKRIDGRLTRQELVNLLNEVEKKKASK